MGTISIMTPIILLPIQHNVEETHAKTIVVYHPAKYRVFMYLKPPSPAQLKNKYDISL